MVRKKKALGTYRTCVPPPCPALILFSQMSNIIVDEYVVSGDNVLWIGRKEGRENLSRYNMDDRRGDHRVTGTSHY